jgi:hypothetical protein
LTRKKLFKIAGIILASLIGLLLLCMAAVTIYINTQKTKLLAQMNAVLDDQIVGNLTIKDFDVSLWRYFPSIELRLLEVTVRDTLKHVPMISAGSLSTTVNMFQLFRKNKTIDDVILEDGVFHLFTDSTGYRNNYVLQPKKQKQSNAGPGDRGQVIIKKILVRNLAITIDDALVNKKIELVIDQLKANLKREDSLVLIRMEEVIRMKTGLGFNLIKGSYFKNSTIEGEWNLKLNGSQKILSFDNTININKHPFDLIGYFNLSEVKKFSIHFSTKDLDYAKATNIVTAAIREKIGVIRLYKPLNVDGIIEGSLLPRQEPYVNINWSTQNNEMDIPVLAFTNCSFTGNFLNEVNKDSARGDPNSRIIMHNFSGNMGGIQLQGKDITITNLQQADIKFHLISSSKLEILDKSFDLDNIRLRGGNADLELKYDGPLSKENIMVGQVEGVFHIRDGSIEYVPHNLLFTSCNGDIAFYPDSIAISKFHCQYKENEFNVEGYGTNVRKKLLLKADGETAAIRLSVSSPAINLDDFDALFGKRVKSTRNAKSKSNFSRTAANLDAMLNNSSIDLRLKSDRLKRGNLDATRFQTHILFLSGLWQIPELSLHLADGDIQTKGQLKKSEENLHLANIHAQLKKVNIQKLFFAFNEFGQHGIQSKNLRGLVSMDANLLARINSSGKIIPGSVESTVNFSIRDGALVDFAPLSNIKNFALKDRDLKDVRFAELKDKLEIKEDMVKVHRMEIASTALHMFVEGNYGLKGYGTDLILQIPFSNLGNPDKAPSNKGVHAKVGPGVLLRAKADDSGKIKLGLTLSKKVKEKE